MTEVHSFFDKLLETMVDEDPRELMPERNARLNLLLNYLESSLAQEEEKSKQIDETFSKTPLNGSEAQQPPR